MRVGFASLLVFFSLFGAALIPPAAHAQTLSQEYSAIQSQGLIFANICTGDYTAECACRDTGRCSVEDVVQVVVNVSYLVFALSGTAALVAFVYGGMLMILANGHPERIEQGKKALSGALIGLAIIFGAYVAINLVVSILKTGEPATTNLETTIGGDADDIITTE